MLTIAHASENWGLRTMDETKLGVNKTTQENGQKNKMRENQKREHQKNNKTRNNRKNK